MPKTTMSMQARNQYLNTLIAKRGGYHLRSKKERSQILDEYCNVTGEHRKAVIRKLRSGQYIRLQFVNGKLKCRVF